MIAKYLFHLIEFREYKHGTYKVDTTREVTETELKRGTIILTLYNPTEKIEYYFSTKTDYHPRKFSTKTIEMDISSIKTGTSFEIDIIKPLLSIMHKG